MRLRSFLVLGYAICCLFGVARAADELRFSQTIAPAEIADTGINRLSSDQVAVLDALVRRDAAAMKMPASSSKVRAARFSQRLSDDERRNAGLTLLDAGQLARLDDRIEKFNAPPPDTSRSFGSGGPRANSTIYTARSLRRDPEIHGSITLLYGVGSGGYSERGGAMTLTYDDPENRFSVAVGYAEIHTKGGYLGRYCRDTFPRSPGDPWW